VCESMSLIEAQEEGVPVGIVAWKVCLRNTTNAMTEVDATCRMHAHVTILHVVKYYICYNMHMCICAYVTEKVVVRGNATLVGECSSRKEGEGGGGGGGATPPPHEGRGPGRPV
jgi:hypothetical protein